MDRLTSSFLDFRCIYDISRRSYHLDHFRRPPQTLEILKNMATEQSGVQLKPMGYGGSRVYALGYIQLGYTPHQRVDHDGGADQQYNIGCHHVCCGRPAASALGQPKTLWGSIGQDDRNDQLMLRESERSLLVQGVPHSFPFPRGAAIDESSPNPTLVTLSCRGCPNAGYVLSFQISPWDRITITIQCTHF